MVYKFFNCYAILCKSRTGMNFECCLYMEISFQHKRRWIWALLITGLSFKASASVITLTSGGKSAYKIIVASKVGEKEQTAATALQTYIEKVSGAKLPISPESAVAGKFEIIVGFNSHAAKAGFKTTALQQGEALILTSGNHILIAGGGPDGVLAAAYIFIEKYLGARLFAYGLPTILKQASITLPNIQLRETPAMAYREAFFQPIYNEEYRNWHHLDFFDIPNTKWGLWGHSFFRLVPPGKYFKSHPEYFAFRNNKRIPNGQLCLSNPEVLEIAIEELKKKMKENPQAVYWSLSQEDNDLYCLCDKCYPLDKKEHSHGASVLNFVNKVAARFPSEKFVTLAYHYSFTPPATIRPAANVIVQISTINAYRQAPIRTAPQDEPIRKGFDAWAKKTGNLMVWDYSANFNHFLCPYPDFEVIKGNIQYYQSKGVKMVFVQGNHHPISDFTELRCYLWSKLLWNPKLDTDEVIREFVNGFYGKGAPFVMQYIQSLHESLKASGKPLGLGDNPVDHYNGYLSPAQLSKYSEYLRQAQEAVGNDVNASYRLRLLRFGIEYVKVEQNRRMATQAGKNAVRAAAAKGKNTTSLFDDFMKECRELGIKRLDDAGTTPAQYAEKYRKDIR